MDVKLRSALQSDVPKIVDFLNDANDPNVLPRPASEYFDSVQMQMLFILEHNNQISGIAGVFPLEHIIFECGSFYIAPVIRGFGLSDVLYSACICGVIVFFGDSDGPIRIATATKPGHRVMESSISRCGFVGMNPVDPVLLVPCSQCSGIPFASTGRQCCCNFYELPTKDIVQHTQFMIQPNPWKRQSFAGSGTMEITSSIFQSTLERDILSNWKP